jgi:predicted Rdx family selenoprotein
MYSPSEATEGEKVDAKKVLLWDRKTEGGFPGIDLHSDVMEEG